MEDHRIIPFQTNLVQRHKLIVEVLGGKIDPPIFQKTQVFRIQETGVRRAVRGPSNGAIPYGTHIGLRATRFHKKKGSYQWENYLTDSSFI